MIKPLFLENDNRLTLRYLCDFYRAMQYSAKRGIAIACRLSVCPSVTLVDQDDIGWKSLKLIARTISPTPSLFVAKTPSTCMGHGEIWGD